MHLNLVKSNQVNYVSQGIDIAGIGIMFIVCAMSYADMDDCIHPCIHTVSH